MILQKLNEARAFIKGMELKKEGGNASLHYKYFTPEQINKMVYEAETKAGLIHLFGMKRDENGIHGYLDIYEIETGEKIEFVQATDIPIIKGTNITQQIGGAVTYTNRYMLMTAFDISDNALDFDAKDNREQPEPKPEVKQPAKAVKKQTDPPKVKTGISDKDFADLEKRIKASKTPLDTGNLLATARQYFIFTDTQEMTIADLTDNAVKI